MYKLYFEDGSGLKDSFREALKEAISQTKTLIYATETRHLNNQLLGLRMDDASHVWGGFALQKDSEFLGLFNYHLLKARESGIHKRLFIRYHKDLYVKGQFEIPEPQPLTYKNILFPFICCGIGII